MYLTSWEVNKGYKAREKKHAELWSAQPPELQAFQNTAHSLVLKRETLLQYCLYGPHFPIPQLS